MGSRERITPQPAERSPNASLPDLHSSDWAPGSKTKQFAAWSARGRSIGQAPSTTSFPKPKERRSTSDSGLSELEKYNRLLERLRWKCTLLIVSHHHYQHAPVHERNNASTQFKLDFFEFYALLERTLVYLLGLFRISVAAFDSDRQPSFASGAKAAVSSRSSSLIGNSVGPSTHRYHANVLQALSEPGPLHDLLGRGTVLENLSMAKYLRNKWKEAGERLQQVTYPAVDVPIPRSDAANGDDKTPDVPSPEVMERMMVSVSDGMIGARRLLEAELSMGGRVGDDMAAAHFRHAEKTDWHPSEDREGMFDSMEDVMEID